jgi:peptidoglycan/LPS O-acetylase OafA/YrhL
MDNLPPDQKGYISNLGGLRGLAALSVAIGHSLMTFKVGGFYNLYKVNCFDGTIGLDASLTVILTHIFSPQSAIVIFFVLSGLVLGLSLDRRTFDIPNILRFYMRRIFRICPAFIIAILLIFIYVKSFLRPHSMYMASEWFNMWYGEQYSFMDLIRNLLFLDNNLLDVAWTLRIEMVVSFLLPIIYLISKRYNFYIIISVLIVLVFLTNQMHDKAVSYWIVAFYVGVLLPRINDIELKRFSGINIQPFIVSLVFLFSYFLLSFKNSLSLQTFIVIHPNRIIFDLKVFIEVSLAALIVYILAYRPTSWMTSFFSSRPMQFMGRVSYSFYIYHFFVSYVLTKLTIRHFLMGRYGPDYDIGLSLSLGLAVSSVAVSLLIAFVSYRFVERPFVGFSRRTF